VAKAIVDAVAKAADTASFLSFIGSPRGMLLEMVF
jgi:hypothetical protein